MKQIEILIIGIGVIFTVCFAYGDTVVLVDGRSFQGKFINGDANTIIFQSDGKTLNFPISLVSSVSFGEKKASGEQTGPKTSEAERKNKGSELKGKGTLKGVVMYYHNRYLGSRPDLGAEIYACKTKTDTSKLKSAADSDEVDDFIKTYFAYFSAKLYRELIRYDRSKSEEYGRKLKELGADTEAGWTELRNRGWKVLWDLESGRNPSKKTTVGGDGTFSLELPGGYYFVILKSKNRSLEDTWECVTIMNDETAHISVEFR